MTCLIKITEILKNMFSEICLPPGGRFLLTPTMGMGGGGRLAHFEIILGSFWINFKTTLGPPMPPKYVFQPKNQFP